MASAIIFGYLWLLYYYNNSYTQRFDVRYWMSVGVRKGFHLSGERLSLSSEHNLTLEPRNSGLRQRSLSRWSIVYLNTELCAAQVWLQSALAVNDERGNSEQEGESSQQQPCGEKSDQATSGAQAGGSASGGLGATVDLGSGGIATGGHGVKEDSSSLGKKAASALNQRLQDIGADQLRKKGVVKDSPTVSPKLDSAGNESHKKTEVSNNCILWME